MFSYSDQIRLDGYAIVEGVISAEDILEVLNGLSSVQAGTEQISGGVRNLLSLSAQVRVLASSDAIRALVEPILGDAAFPVRGILFDKTPAANWKIPWHQDVTIAVKHRTDCAGYGPWSTKAGVQHVQPPALVSEQMLSVRIHLDDCPETNGALRVLAGTHAKGKLTHSETEALVAQHRPSTCEVKAGDVLVMRPLLLHASSQSSSGSHRRVVHIDFAACELACGLQWNEKLED